MKCYSLPSILKLVVVGILVIVYVNGAWLRRSVASTSNMAEFISVVKATWVVVAKTKRKSLNIGLCVNYRLTTSVIEAKWMLGLGGKLTD